jgi:hypothetical protein
MSRSALALVASLTISAGTLACSSGDDSSQADAAQPDTSMADVSMDASTEPLPLPPVPSVQYLGGTVLTTPNIIPIVYSGNTNLTDIQAFLNGLATSAYFKQVTQEYDAGASMTVASPVILTDTPPTMIDDAQIAPWLISEVQGDAGLFPPASPNNIYVIFYPSSTTVTFKAYGWTLCENNLGYHDNTANPQLVYAVIPDCGPVMGRTTTPLDSITSIASHEIVEAVTDPFATTETPAWATLDMQHAVWELSPGSEIGDLCAFQPQSYQRIVGSYVIQRMWSNASAAAGHDPCVPLLSTPYFNAIPLFSGNVTIGGVPLFAMTAGIKIPVGQSMTVPVQFISDGTTGDWHVTAQNEPPTLTELSFTWDVSSGNNGDVHQLTITRMSNDTSGKKGTEFRLASLGSGVSDGQQNLWWGFVGQ